ncbi:MULTISPECIES: terminase large subunit [unclassified Bacillus (in: firmicutes)]|uniref:terminase large subunit n=1 Tax=unclassified Bacillus (in: firmicutes) TaxID=185979 RepID=UPI000D046F33|nr:MULTISPECIES: terminase TerL endonuclease subunit [unclassified Bacillus (in: firmicutes)]PRR92917.1 terminase large subunit [Bacillus sp. NMCN1]PRR95346.1 terminase large subunit [Bacillus sp. NMCN6]
MQTQEMTAELLIERVWSYCEKIEAGEIKAGKKHKWAVQRFIKDVERLADEDCLYYFDAEAVLDFYEWAKQFNHVEGILAGKPIELTDFQLFIAANIYGFYKKENGARRFRKVYIQLARKNAKSQLLAIMASYEIFPTQEKHRVFIAGWSRDQSDEVYQAILEQLHHAPILEGKYTDANGKIKKHNTNSIIQPLSREARKVGDGKNPSLGIVDEYHAHETSEIYDVLNSGMVARRSPLMVIITTAGYNLNGPCFKEYQYTSKILDPDVDTKKEDYFVLICELDPSDDVKDESNWIKANPIVATYEEGMTSLRSDLETALEVPEKMRSFLTKNMDRWTDQKDNGYMKMSKWRACHGEIPDLKEMAIYLGIDLSMTTDLTSVGWVGVLDGFYYVGQHSFIPEEKAKEKMATDKVPYDLWRDQGWMTFTPGEAVDYQFVERWIIEFAHVNKLRVIEAAYDKWNALHLAQRLESKGFNMVELPQRIQYLSLPTKDYRQKVYERKVIHTDDPLLTFAYNNAILKQDPQENIMLDKAKSPQRIDPAAAVMNAFARAMYHDMGANVDLNEHFSGNFSF